MLMVSAILLQPFLSVAISEYFPAGSLETIFEVSPVDHRYLTKVSILTDAAQVLSPKHFTSLYSITGS